MLLGRLRGATSQQLGEAARQLGPACSATRPPWPPA